MKPASGKFVLRVSPDLHRRLRELADRRGQSLNQACRAILERAVPGGGEGAGRAEAASAAPLERLARCCRDAFGSDLVGLTLFGSVARGEEFPQSDLDLLLVMRDQCPIRRGLYAKWEADVGPSAERHLAREVTPHFAHLPRSPEGAGGLWLEVSIDGTVLWERGREVSDKLRAIRAYLATGRVTRLVRHGHPYWVRD